MYRCSKCGMAVIVLPDVKPIKACKCSASVIADMTAVTTGKGGIKA